MGEILVKSGLIDDETLAKALEIQKSQKRRLGQILVDMGVSDVFIDDGPLSELRGQCVESLKRTSDAALPDLSSDTQTLC